MVERVPAIMLGFAESKITIELPSVADMDNLTRNLTRLVNRLEEGNVGGGGIDEDKDDKILTDVWVGIVLTLLVLSCSACMCSCLLYHKFQMWKRRELEARARAAALAIVTIENADSESLPSYTVASGLPTYEEALETLKSAKEEISRTNNNNDTIGHTPPPAFNPQQHMSRLSVADLLMIYRQSSQTSQDENKA